MDPQQRVALRLAWRSLENSGINPDDLAGHDVGCYVGASALEYGPGLSEFSHHSGHLISGTSLGRHLGAHRLHAGPGRAGPDDRHLLLVVVDRAAHRGCGDRCGRLRPRAGRWRLCDGHPGLLRRVLQAARALRRRPLPGLQRARERDRLGRGRGHVRPAAPVQGGGRRSSGAGGGPRQLPELRRAQQRADGAQRRGAAAPVPAGHRPRRGRARRGRDGRRPRNRDAARRPAPNCSRWPPVTAPRPAGRGPLLGSVKSNVGHAQAAAGGLGLAKVLLSAQHGAIPPTLHVDEPSREIDWESQGLRLADKLTPWPAVDGRRIAAVSAFGMSGTNTHLIVSDARRRRPGRMMTPTRLPDGRTRSC